MSNSEAHNVHKPRKVCPGCPFNGPKVGSKGDPKANIVFVAESPGQEEKRIGQPLVGPSGRIFHEFVPEEGIYVLNALECYPLAALKNDQRMNHATQCCRDRVLMQVGAHPRRIIVAMGNAALRSLTGDYTLKITQARGKLIPSPLAELGILPVVHIAALMRGGGNFRQWKQDINYALDLASGRDPIPYEPAKVIVVPGTDYWGRPPVSRSATQGDVDTLFARMLDGTDSLTGDIETSGFDHVNDRILSVGITSSNDTKIGYCFYPEHLPLIKPHLESHAIKWCWHNGKFDIKFLRQAGINARVDDDTMLLSYCLDESGGVHDLETVAADTIGAPDYKHMLQPYLPNKQASYELVPPEVLAEYQAIDTANTARIRPILRRRVARDPALEKLYTRTLIPASETLAWVEANGICTDPQRIEENEAYFGEMKASLQTEIQEMVGYPINPGSPKQVSRLLFHGYKFPNRAKGSTSVDVLERLQRETEHPIFALLMRHRKAVKMYGTYVKGLLKHLHPDTNRIHATFLLHGTRTGRLAARNPNMQNPPRDPQIRGSFVAAPGYELVEIDLSQAEMRSLAALSGDPLLIEIFASGRSPHKDLSVYLSERGTFKPNWEARYAAWQANPESPEHFLAKEEYTRSKNVNFGIMYGISPFGLMDQINDTKAVAIAMLEGWSERYPVASAFINKCRNTPVNNQIITTCFGRKKRVGLVSRGTLRFLQNEAANFPHQSIASDITLHTAMRIMPQLKVWGVRIVNLIHDAILMERPLDGVPREVLFPYVAQTFQQVPIDWGITAVPFVSEADFGHRWGTLATYEGDLYG